MTPPAELKTKVAKLLADRGIDKTCDLLKLTPETVYRLANGDDVRSGSINLAVERLKAAAGGR